jgi:hypothetical protein
MNSNRIQLLLTGFGVWISFLLMITTTYGASIVIGGDYTDIGTIVVISPKPGDTPQNNGTALLNNLAGISADATHPYVIKLGPGIYDIGVATVEMKPYVDIEGSGESTTAIKGNGQQVVGGASFSEMRFLTVLNDSTSEYFCFAVVSTDSSVKMTNVTAISSSSLATVNHAIRNVSASPQLLNVKAVASNGTAVNRAIHSEGGSAPIMMNVQAEAYGGNFADALRFEDSNGILKNVTTYAVGGALSSYGLSTASSTGNTIHVTHSMLSGASGAITNASSVSTFVAHSQISGGVSNSGTLKCIGAYDPNYDPLSASCQ